MMIPKATEREGHCVDRTTKAEQLQHDDPT